MRLEEGKYYHLYNRSVNYELLFKEENNYLFFLRRYAKYTKELVNTFAYCLMPTHFHFFVQIKAADETTKPAINNRLIPAEQAFQNVFISYSKAINKAFNRHGSLFQNKYKKKEVNDASYFSQIIAYIHYNPVRAKLCISPEEWTFSSYKAFLSHQNTLIKREEVLDWFGGEARFVSFHHHYDPTKNINKYLFK